MNNMALEETIIRQFLYKIEITRRRKDNIKDVQISQSITLTREDLESLALDRCRELFGEIMAEDVFEYSASLKEISF